MSSKDFKKEFLKAVKAYLDGTATEEQLFIITEYFNLFEELDEILESQNIIQMGSIKHRLFSSINNEIEKKSKITIVRSPKYLYMAAAVVLVTFISVFLYQTNQPGFKSDLNNSQQILTKIVPGGNKATLTLANGSKISLSDLKNGEIANQFGTVITKTMDSQLVYQNSVASIEKRLAYNTMETPRGGQFQVVLPDGTRVWLNAASSLRYPLAFEGHERKVELIGEAYFEVAKDKARPFKVYSASQIVQVLGTHFNINAYTTEPAELAAVVIDPRS